MKTTRKTHAPSKSNHVSNHLQEFMLQHDPIYADNFARTAKDQVLVLRYQFNSSLNRLKRAGIISATGQPVFRNEPAIIPSRRA